MKNFYNSKIKFIDIEPTSFCNAKCPHCLRESRNGDYSFFKQKNLDVDFFEQKFSKKIASEAEIVSFSGNIGEPAMNKHLIDIIKWFRKQNPSIFIEIYTNGSIQKSEWWFELGKIIQKNGNVIFAIDGLEDTNHIYRVNVKWNKLIENVKSFISSKSISTWQFIPFKHNEHQVEEARILSQTLGFNYFKIKISHRELLSQPQNKFTKVEPATKKEYTHNGTPLDLKNIDKTETYLNSLNIKCYAIETSNIYISAEGLVFPCCHTASLFLLDNKLLPMSHNWIGEAKNKLNKSDLDLNKNSLEQIISSKSFNNIKNSWALKMNQGKNPICAVICGKCDSNSLIEGLLGI